MKEYRLNIDGIEVKGLPGQTILEVARENDIFIPTLCFDERTKIYGACGLCVVEVEGNPKLCKACATEIAPGMVVMTQTERVIESRKTNLELLISNHNGDCVGPCMKACPAHTDCQGYVGLIANGEFELANELIKDKIPLPASIGRVCPHPCEDACRRGLVDQPISIAALKRFAGDYDLTADENFVPEIADETGKSVAIIGGGPMGLSAAYFLRQKGHDVTIFDAMPKLGGMMRYGIPEYRLPKEVLDAEIDIIEEMGVEIVTNTKIGEDLSFETVYNDFDAVLLGIGAWVSTGVGCPGEDAEGVIGGIDFLRSVVRNTPIDFGKRVAIVGGGNTAMDACRTAVRLGAEEVYNVYRRTKNEMPADRLEIEEAEEEGVIFKNLTNPLKIVKDRKGHVKQMVLQVMELGEPDASGRRKPVPVKGKTETLDVDTVILAIGQAVNAKGFDLAKTRKGGIKYDPKTMMTDLPGVFAGGDCGNDKISIAVEAIADAKRCAESIDAYLNGEAYEVEDRFYVERTDVTAETFEDRERLCREKADQLTAAERKDNFSEVVYSGLSPEQAVAEASRCLECGCHDYYECKLVDFANQYHVEPERLAGEKNLVKFEDDHPFIVRDPNKCILCGLCVRVCDEVMGVAALGLVHRGFDTVVKPELEKPLLESPCESCGQCVAICPVGALQERQTVIKEVPLDTEITETTCANCAVGCSLLVESYGDMLVKANPDKEGYVNAGLCCGKGKWGFDAAVLEGRETDPMVLVDGELAPADYHEALMMTAKKMEAIRVRNGAGSLAVAISDRYTNEEAYAMKKFARLIGAKIFSFNNRKNALFDVFGLDATPNTIDELLSTEVILVPGFIKNRSAVIWNKIKQAAEAGAKVYVINTPEAQSHFKFATKIVEAANTTDVLAGIAKALLDMGKSSKAPGFEEFAASVAKAKVTDDVKEIAAAYAGAKKAMIVYQQNVVSVEAARLLGEIAALSGHIGKPRDGILLVKAKNNSQGLVDLGIRAGSEELKGVKGLIIFGEDPIGAGLITGFGDLEFLMVSDCYLTDTAIDADVFIPATGPMSAFGTYTNTERRLMPVEPVIDDEVELTNWEIAAELAHVYEEEFGFEDEVDISFEMEDLLPLYKYAEVGEILGGVLKPVETKFFPYKKAKLVDELPCTDTLMNINSDRIPLPGAAD
ncbi:MAG: FAD-dependent oxidoreductase [Firmicutes bacterium]|nr:FAD-dependent oxidoreductase [Bacillota bacterium]